MNIPSNPFNPRGPDIRATVSTPVVQSSPSLPMASAPLSDKPSSKAVAPPVPTPPTMVAADNLLANSQMLSNLVYMVFGNKTLLSKVSGKNQSKELENTFPWEDAQPDGIDEAQPYLPVEERPSKLGQPSDNPFAKSLHFII